MDIQASARRANFALSNVRLLNNFNSAMSDDAFVAFLRREFVKPGAVRTVRIALEGPKYFTFANEDLIYIGILGATSGATVNQCWGGYNQSRDVRPDSGCHRPADASGVLVIQGLQGSFIENLPRVIIAAHSYGACVGMAIAARLQPQLQHTLFTLVTFGGTKTGDDRTQVFAQGIDTFRWMNSGDALCIMPPLTEQAPILSVLSTPQLINNRAQFVQCGFGKVMFPDGTTNNDLTPTFDQPFPDLSLANFLVNNEAPTAIEHALPTYLDRLSVQQDKENQALLDAIPVPAGAAIQPANAADHRRDDVRAALIVPADFFAPPPVVPPPPLPSRPAPDPEAPLPYFSQRRNGKYGVYHRETDFLLAICAGGKAARNLARSLNTSWRRWNRTKVGDGPALEFSVGEEFKS